MNIATKNLLETFLMLRNVKKFNKPQLNVYMRSNSELIRACIRKGFLKTDRLAKTVSRLEKNEKPGYMFLYVTQKGLKGLEKL